MQNSNTGPNEGLNDSSRGKCRIIMPQSGVGATPHKGLITENKDSACRSRTSERRHIKGLYHISLIQQFGNINYHKHETQNKVSPSTGITINLKFYHLSLFTGDRFFTRIDMDIMFTLLIMATMIWKELTLQSLYLTTANGFQ